MSIAAVVSGADAAPALSRSVAPWRVWIAALIFLAVIAATAALALTGRTAPYVGRFLPANVPAKTKKIVYVRLAPQSGMRGVQRVILTEPAVQRLGIKMAPIVAFTGMRMRTIPGVIATENGSDVVKVALSGSLDLPVAGSTALIRPLAAPKGQQISPARQTAATAEQLTLAFDRPPTAFKAGDRVWAEIQISEAGAERSAVPYSAVVYDANGRTWAFTNPQPLTYVRQAIAIDYITADATTAVLREAPPIGTPVVVQGAVELDGAENKFGH